MDKYHLFETEISQKGYDKIVEILNKILFGSTKAHGIKDQELRDFAMSTAIMSSTEPNSSIRATIREIQNELANQCPTYNPDCLRQTLRFLVWKKITDHYTNKQNRYTAYKAIVNLIKKSRVGESETLGQFSKRFDFIGEPRETILSRLDSLPTQTQTQTQTPTQTQTQTQTPPPPPPTQTQTQTQTPPPPPTQTKEPPPPPTQTSTQTQTSTSGNETDQLLYNIFSKWQTPFIKTELGIGLFKQEIESLLKNRPNLIDAGKASVIKQNRQYLMPVESSTGVKMVAYDEWLISQNILPFDVTDLIQEKNNIQYQQVKTEVQEMISSIESRGNVILAGGAGTGKSQLVMRFAFVNSFPIIKFPCTVDTDESDIIGRLSIDIEGKIGFSMGVLTQAIIVSKIYGGCVLLLDEFNVLREAVQKMINSALDDTRLLKIPILPKPLVLDRPIFTFGTMNKGYAGTRVLPTDVADRFDIVDMPRANDETIKNILKSSINIEAWGIDEYILDIILDYRARIAKAQTEGTIGDKVIYEMRSMQNTLRHLARLKNLDGFFNAPEATRLIKAFRLTFIYKFVEKSDRDEADKIAVEMLNAETRFPNPKITILTLKEEEEKENKQKENKQK